MCLTPLMEGFPWDDLRKILPVRQQMASVPNGIEILPKISIACVECTNFTDRQTDDRQTDGRAMTTKPRHVVEVWTKNAADQLQLPNNWWYHGNTLCVADSVRPSQRSDRNLLPRQLHRRSHWLRASWCPTAVNDTYSVQYQLNSASPAGSWHAKHPLGNHCKRHKLLKSVSGVIIWSFNIDTVRPRRAIVPVINVRYVRCVLFIHIFITATVHEVHWNKTGYIEISARNFRL